MHICITYGVSFVLKIQGHWSILIDSNIKLQRWGYQKQGHKLPKINTKISKNNLDYNIGVRTCRINTWAHWILCLYQNIWRKGNHVQSLEMSLVLNALSPSTKSNKKESPILALKLGIMQLRESKLNDLFGGMDCASFFPLDPNFMSVNHERKIRGILHLLFSSIFVFPVLLCCTNRMGSDGSKNVV